MRTTQKLMFALLTLALTAYLGPEGQSASAGPDSPKAASGRAQSQLAVQSAVDWPPKAIPNPKLGPVPDYSDKNENCLDCHDDILDAKVARPEILNPHRRHLESKNIAYKGDNRDCTTCHEMMTYVENAPEKEGWFVVNDVYHPNSAGDPAGVWKKLMIRPGMPANYTATEGMQPMAPNTPHIFKPTLKRLVCLTCHGPESKIKTFYGAPDATK